MPAFNSKLIDLTGQVFGRLTVIHDTRLPCKGRKNGRRAWVCQCECGTILTRIHGEITSGNIRSCGCLEREMLILRNKKGRPIDAPNFTEMPEYGIWADIIKRCTNPKSISFVNYGQRGIIVCDRWRNSFEHFLEDMGTRPSYQHQIERIDNHGNYEPSNCKWATRSEQSRNKRNNHWLTVGDETLCITDWANRLGTSAGVIRGRILLGWSPHKIVTEPVRSRNADP